MEVPLEHCFVTLSEARGGDGVSEEEDMWPKRLASSMSLELLKGKDSLYHEYFRDLPSMDAFKKCLPQHWNAEELALFELLMNSEGDGDSEVKELYDFGGQYILDEIMPAIQVLKFQHMYFG